MGADTELAKATWKPKFLSEFSMGGLDFERYNKWLDKADTTCATIQATDVPSIELVQQYFAEVNVLYKNWRAIISFKPLIEKIDAAVIQARTMKRQWETAIDLKTPFSKKRVLELVDLLNDLHTELLDIKQRIGLGIAVRKNLSVKQRIKMGMGVTDANKKWENMPEP